MKKVHGPAYGDNTQITTLIVCSNVLGIHFPQWLLWKESEQKRWHDEVKQDRERIKKTGGEDREKAI